MKTKKEFITYLVVTFSVAWIMQIIACHFANTGYLNIYNTILAFSMFAPLLGAIVAAKGNVKKIGWKPKFRHHGKYYWFSWLMPLVLTVAGGTLFFAIFPSSLGTLEEGLNNVGGEGFVEVLTMQGVSPALFLLIEILSAAVYAPLINAFFAVGEEAGWRGVMYPYLKEKFGKVKGRIFGGCIWGVWHWPVMILAGYEYGKVYIGSPILGLILFPIFTSALGILCDWVYEKTESIWAPAVLHGAINGTAGLPLLFLATGFETWSILGPTVIGLIGGLPLIALATIILIKESKTKES